jgi:hypothetical protein
MAGNLPKTQSTTDPSKPQPSGALSQVSFQAPKLGGDVKPLAAAGTTSLFGDLKAGSKAIGAKTPNFGLGFGMTGGSPYAPDGSKIAEFLKLEKETGVAAAGTVEKEEGESVAEEEEGNEWYSPANKLKFFAMGEENEGDDWPEEDPPADS